MRVTLPSSCSSNLIPRILKRRRVSRTYTPGGRGLEGHLKVLPITVFSKSTVKSNLNKFFFHKYPFQSGYAVSLKFNGFICFCLNSILVAFPTFLLIFKKICITLAWFQKSKLCKTVHFKKCYSLLYPTPFLPPFIGNQFYLVPVLYFLLFLQN